MEELLRRKKSLRRRQCCQNTLAELTEHTGKTKRFWQKHLAEEDIGGIGKTTLHNVLVDWRKHLAEDDAAQCCTALAEEVVAQEVHVWRKTTLKRLAEDNATGRLAEEVPSVGALHRAYAARSNGGRCP